MVAGILGSAALRRVRKASDSGISSSSGSARKPSRPPTQKPISQPYSLCTSAITPLAALPAENSTSAIAMKKARHLRGVISDSSASPIGSIAEKKIPDSPRRIAMWVTVCAQTATIERTPKQNAQSASTGRRPMRSASGGIAKAPTAMPT